MIDRAMYSLLYWDLNELPSIDLKILLKRIERLNQLVLFKQIIIVANEKVIPAKIELIAKSSLNADIFLPNSIKLRDISDNTLHHGRYVDTKVLVEKVWKGEQLIVIGHQIENAICIGEGEVYDYTYDDLIHNIKILFE